MIRLELIIVNLLQFTNMAVPRGLVKTVIPVSLKPKRIRTLEYAFSITLKFSIAVKDYYTYIHDYVWLTEENK